MSLLSTTTSSSLFNEWLWPKNSGKYVPQTHYISKLLNNLQIGEKKIITKIYGNTFKYEWFKLSNDVVEQTNLWSNKTRKLLKKKQLNTCNIDDDDIWIWQTDNGDWKQQTNNISLQLSNLKIGQKKYIKMGLWVYEWKKLAIDLVQQINIKTKNIRVHRLKISSNYNKINNLNIKQVECLFYNSLFKYKYKYKIIDIKLIQNNKLLSVYNSILNSKYNENPNKSDIELLAWHGTKNLSNISLIIENGFDRSYNTRSKYGNGVYFAKYSSYSVQNGFCGKDCNNIYSILLCKIIVGNYCKGSSLLTKIPKKNNGKEYDSLVDKINNPSIFVIWRDYHAIPYYLVKYKIN